MISFPDATAFENTRWVLGGVCLVAAWLFPFYSVASRDALQQMFALGMFGVASLLFGMSAIAKLPFVILAVSLVAMALAPGTYWASHVAGFAGILLAGIGAHVGAHAGRNTNRLHVLIASILIAAFCNAAEGLLQWFGLVPGLSPWVIEPERRGVAYGVFRQPNLFATFVCVGVVCAIWLVEIRRLTEMMAWFLLVMLVFAVVASGSRSGAFELVALALAGCIWRKQQSTAVTRLMVGQLLLFALGSFVLPIAAAWHGFDFVTGITRVASATQDARILVWSNAVDLILERPWLGWGWSEMGYGHYVTVFPHRFNELLDHSHNLFLQVGVEFGLPAASALFSVIVWMLYSGRPWQTQLERSVTGHSKDDRQKNGGLPSWVQNPIQSRQFAWLILFLIGIHSMLELPLWSAGFLFLTGLAVGFLMPATIAFLQPRRYAVWSVNMAALCAAGLIALASVAWHQFDKVDKVYKAPFNDKVAQRAALASASDAWLFRANIDFVAIGLHEVTLQNALEVRKKGEDLLHFSAQPQVIVPLLASLRLLKDAKALQFHVERFCRAFPAAYIRWSEDRVNLDSHTLTGRLLAPACHPKPL